MSRTYGPWIEHDGKGLPWDIISDAKRRGGLRWDRCFSEDRDLRQRTSFEQANPGESDPDSPTYVWTYRRSFLPPFARRRVCADPNYSPLLKYRFIFDTPPSAQVEMLREIVLDPPSELIGEDA